MLSVIAVLPQPPLLVPELTGGAAVETEALREACRATAADLAAAARTWIVVGADSGGRRSVEPGTTGTFAGYGRDVPVVLPGGEGRIDDEGPGLPLPLLIAGWAAAGAGTDLRVRGELVGPDAGVADCLALGAELADAAGRGAEDVGLLVVGDGAARHSERSPGGFDGRAEAFDGVVAAALDAADPEPLAALDPELARELWAAGRAPWQVLAGAARAAGTWSGTLRHTSAPYGVAYHVALWNRE
ncbi:hypothetical protein [Pseudonocardia sp. KRD291]|uniref:hypothetical protein n=1 Tax=Pseudonocardia sp. KRD291 TaxID=2792007 RepID=UPI001C4A6A05|nr:hypothetical protein [Pseudonocardia sp. KRD291]MBW0104728.1 hypothetical protein [Pseudonocardia sp. KRD291]